MGKVGALRGRACVSVSMLALALALPRSALAQPAPSASGELPAAAPEDPKVERARELYKSGIEDVKRERWSEALSAFESSAELRPHATTTFNIAACERALGHYTRAREILRQALDQGKRE